MLNQALTQDMLWRTQADRIIKSLDEWLQIYTEATMILFIVILILLGWLALYDRRASKTGKKPLAYQKTRRERPLLQTEP
jgi:preprotein translocase subunit SecG